MALAACERHPVFQTLPIATPRGLCSPRCSRALGVGFLLSTMTDDQRLRALDLRTEDVVLLRVIAGVALRIVGIPLAAWGASEVVRTLAWMLQPTGFGAPAPGQVLVFVAGPGLLALTGVVLVAMGGPMSRRLIAHRVPAARCPGCRYTITTLDAGRCTECGYLISPLRDAPRSASDRLLVARSIVATGVRLCGIGLLIYGIGRLLLHALADVMLEVRPLVEEYEASRQMLWWGIALVLGLLTFGLADWIARIALLGLKRGNGPKEP